MRFVNIPRYTLAALLSLSSFLIAKAAPKNGKYKVAINREDGRQIFFNLVWEKINGKTTVTFINGTEALKTTDIQLDGDSITINMPVFESSFRLKSITPDSLSGFWVRKLPSSELRLPVSAISSSERFPMKSLASANLSGKYAINFERKDGKQDPAIVELQQNGSKITGSILTPTGDYRFLEGIVNGDSLWLSTFDGVHALVFSGKVDTKKNISGAIWSGAKSYETYSGKKEDNPTLPNTSAMYVKDGESGHLDFSFKDLDGKLVSIKDARFKNKVVIIDLMGSWCPNCMDETAFLSEFYKKNKNRGVEVVGLAYEYSDNFERSRKSLAKFQKKFNVTYPMLITGVTVMDPQRTEKTLPQLTDIKMFPSTIILDKTGKVSFIDTGFQGPGTGDYYKAFVKEFNKKIDNLLK
ncbi:MAG: TlpA family protein disulfide reductase [Pseudopedobacter saltans]|uniref:TlpA family protein disulfide reductase n=1 Tax=Pseudopedobacter saltans TaxID=151895 RepID=A0A2W5EMM4_9SPHI|nr:MAG: TlpA family protein disulfide reductase [Pseudopedobacter saltans]